MVNDRFQNQGLWLEFCTTGVVLPVSGTGMVLLASEGRVALFTSRNKMF